MVGSRFNLERKVCIVIDRSRLPSAMPLTLALDDEGAAFPAIDFVNQVSPVTPDMDQDMCDSSLLFLEEARVKTRFGCSTGILTLGKGSRFDCMRRHTVGNHVPDVAADDDSGRRDGRRPVHGQRRPAR